MRSGLVLACALAVGCGADSLKPGSQAMVYDGKSNDVQGWTEQRPGLFSKIRMPTGNRVVWLGSDFTITVDGKPSPGWNRVKYQNMILYFRPKDLRPVPPK